ncbi:MULTISPECIES: hypothetical protein [unclassified Staphylococcus]|uniref:hypothetical protein n=1 Tax=Staphylococcus TaxID=1279 RepID=UPI00085C2CB4|nr:MULTISPECIES: hypothetical protein [unclassified Staphylococcus]SCS91405.1 Uncharacterised protein [Staphylococcus cohnii subsp. cohnii]
MNNKLITPPIVDTDIWVYLVLSDYHKRIIKYYGYLFFSDVVEREIMGWKKNSPEFSKIANLFQELKGKNYVKIIRFGDFDELSQATINHTLSEYDLQSVEVLEKNKGEFTSLLYALYKDIHRFKTNDRNFKEQIQESIDDDFTFVNWNDILDNYSNSFKEKLETQKRVDTKQQKMKKQNEEHKQKNQDPRWEKLKNFLV